MSVEFAPDCVPNSLAHGRDILSSIVCSTGCSVVMTVGSTKSVVSARSLGSVESADLSAVSVVFAEPKTSVVSVVSVVSVGLGNRMSGWSH